MIPRRMVATRLEWVGHKVLAHVSDVRYRMRLHEIVTQVLATGAPVDIEVAKAHTLPDPMVAHHDGLGAALLDTVRCNALGTFIVRLERGGSLWVSQVMKGLPQWFSFLAIEKECDIFALGG